MSKSYQILDSQETKYNDDQYCQNNLLFSCDSIDLYVDKKCFPKEAQENKIPIDIQRID